MVIYPLNAHYLYDVWTNKLAVWVVHVIAIVLAIIGSFNSGRKFNC